MAERDSFVRDVKKRGSVEPRAGIRVECAARQLLDRGYVRMTEHDQVEFRFGRLHSGRGGEEPTSSVARRITAARVRAVVCERRREIGMQPTERPNRQGVSQETPHETIPFVFSRSKSISVLDMCAPRADRVAPRTEHIVDSDIATKHVTAPTVVVAGDHHDLHARIHDIGEGGKRSESSARNDGAPLEPELEQIAVDHERAAMCRDVSQERDDRAFDFAWRETEVRIRQDVARCVEHARILRAPSALYKRRHPNELGRVTTDSPTHSTAPLFHDVDFRVRYAETDQMGVVYHTNYLVWCEVGRTDFIRARGMSYADMERAGVGLAVSELTARFHSAARYDDMIRVRTTLAEVRSRGITFDYLITRLDDGHRLVSARTSLVSIDGSGRPIALPSAVRALFGSV